MPSTLVHALLPGGCSAYRGRRGPWRRYFVLGAILGNLPDLDIALGLCFPEQFNHIHRNFGHNVFVLPLWIGLGAWLLGRFGGPAFAGRRRFLAASLLVVSHHVLDAMTVHQIAPASPGTVPLFWPLAKYGWELPWRIFQGVPPQYQHANPIWDRISSPRFWRQTIFVELFWTGVLFIAWVAFSHLFSKLFAQKKTAPVLP